MSIIKVYLLQDISIPHVPKIPAPLADTKAVDLDDTLLQTPSGKDYLVSEFTENTVAQFEKALQIRRELIAKRTGRDPDAEEALSEVTYILAYSYAKGIVVDVKTFLTLLNQSAV